MIYNNAKYEATVAGLKVCISTYTNDDNFAEAFRSDLMKLREAKVEFMRHSLETAEFKVQDMNMYDH